MPLEPELSRVACKAPPFWEANPELWFLQLESQFILADVKVDDTKFHIVISALDSKILSYVSDIISKPPSVNKYDTLKARIVQHFSQSQSAKLRALLQDLQLGDRRPSQLLQEMKNLASGGIGDDVLKSLWINRLPTATQQILAVSNDSLDGLAMIADKINEVSHFDPVVNTVITDSSSIQSLKNEIAELRAEFRRTSRPRFRRCSSDRQWNNFRKRSPSQKHEFQTHKICWYHKRFAKKALKCVKPCNFQEN